MEAKRKELHQTPFTVRKHDLWEREWEWFRYGE